eukprot:gene17080-18801_t
MNTNVSDVDPCIWKQLSTLLNPRMVVGGDWTSMAGKMGFKYQDILNFDRERDPTAAVLHEWSIEKGLYATVSELILILRNVQRNDAVELLKEHELTQNNVKCPYSESDNIPAKENSDRQIPNGGHRIALENDSSFANGYALAPVAVPVLVDNNAGIPEDQPVACGTRPTTLPHLNGIRSTPVNGLLSHGSEHCGNLDHISNAAEKPEATENSTDRRTYVLQHDGMILNSSEEHIEAIEEAEEEDAKAQYQAEVEGRAQCLTPFTISPHDKIALVMGNQNYISKGFNTLSYALNDAYDMSVALRDVGFKVISLMDLTLSEMRTAMLALCRLIGPGIFAVVYYAGHGFELEGENYLVPVDVTGPNTNGCIRAQEFLQEMQSCGTLLNLMFLDCCRSRVRDSKPPSCYLKRSSKGNTIIAYSCLTQHGAFEEPNQKNGVYAKHLLQNIRRDARIENILMDVNAAVTLSRSVEQRPTFESDAYFDCRLTAPILPEDDISIVKERSHLWNEGSVLPKAMLFNLDDVEISLNFVPAFSNMLSIELRATVTGQAEVKNLDFKVDVFSPLFARIFHKSKDILKPGDKNIHIGDLKIFHLQKLVNENVLLSMEFTTSRYSKLLKLDFETPLIAGITSKFHEWIMDRDYFPSSIGSSSWL